jgi:signal peptidase I
VEARPEEAPEPREPEPRAASPEHPHHRGSFWKELPVLIVIAFAIALLIKTFLLQAFFIPSASMEPTLKIGDRVLVEKVGYRFGGAGRGDVVVFEKDVGAIINPEAADDDDPFYVDIANAFRELFGFPTGSKQDFIKRVIAIGGDTVQGRDGHVLVNGEAIAEPYLPEGTETSDFGPVEIPDGMIFVMGDNRANSDDSRSFGPVDEGKVVGRAFVLIWPPADVGTL